MTNHSENQQKLITFYKNEIEDILSECEHVYRLTIDYELLNSKVKELMIKCHEDGLEEKIVWDLLQARIPSFVNYVNYKNSGKKAA